MSANKMPMHVRIRRAVTRFEKKHGRTPTAEEYRGLVLGLDSTKPQPTFDLDAFCASIEGQTGPVSWKGEK